MDMKVETIPKGGGQIVYVRAVDVRDLPDDFPDDLREQVKEISNLFAVHDTDGGRLALVKGRRLAFALARENDYTPVPVH